MSKDKIRIVYKKVNKEPKTLEIEKDLETMQRLVGGLIEVVYYDNDNEILLVCNDEGKLLNMKPNILFDYDYIAGDCFFVGDDYKNAGFKSLSDEQIEKIEEMLEKRSLINITFDEEMEI